MNFRNSVFIVLAIFQIVPVASAAEAVWPRGSASELSTFITLLRFRIYADHCSAGIPQLKPKFESLIKNLDGRIQGIAKGLFASDLFQGMKEKQVPAEIIDAFRDAFDDVKHNVERRDAASICPKTLQNLDEMDDEALKFALSETLTTVQNMIRNLERDRASARP